MQENVKLVLQYFVEIIYIIDACRPNPCWNGGRCTPKENSYHCHCTSGHSGMTCLAKGSLYVITYVILVWLAYSNVETHHVKVSGNDELIIILLITNLINSNTVQILKISTRMQFQWNETHKIYYTSTCAWFIYSENDFIQTHV